MHPPITRPSSRVSDVGLPPELLLEVFSHFCQPPSNWPLPLHLTKRHPGPLFLGKICKQWRHIVWSSPTLWTYIDFVVLPHKDVIQKLLDEYLSRSNDLPLTIVFRKGSLPEDHYRRHLNTIPYVSIFRESYRWEVVDIFLPHIYMKNSEQLPALRKVFLMGVGGRFQTEAGFIRNAPELRVLMLDSCRLDVSDVDPPYLHLTEFNALGLDHLEVSKVLKKAPNLKSCFLSSIAISSDGGTATPVFLQRLEVLAIYQSVGAELVEFQPPTILRKFRFEAAPGRPLPLMLIQRLLHRSRTLEVLDLRTTDLRMSGINAFLDPILRRLVNLKELILHSDDVDEQIATDIAKILNPLWPPAPPLPIHGSGTFMDGDNPVILPNLRHLELQMETGSLLPILTMLKHRWMFGDGEFSSLPQGSSGRGFARIVSARLPRRYHSSIIKELGDEIRDGMLVDFIP